MEYSDDFSPELARSSSAAPIGAFRVRNGLLACDCLAIPIRVYLEGIVYLQWMLVRAGERVITAGYSEATENKPQFPDSQKTSPDPVPARSWDIRGFDRRVQHDATKRNEFRGFSNPHAAHAQQNAKKAGEALKFTVATRRHSAAITPPPAPRRKTSVN